MKKSVFSSTFWIVFFVFVGLFSLEQLHAQTPAFPGAAGGGMFVTGGRGGRVIYVTSLADTNTEGTLRWAIGQSGARIILFRVSGIITLTSSLRINNGNVTIAGQTAPGDGITLRNYEMFINADNVIIRFVRFRLGNAVPTVQSDAIWSRYRRNIIIDHCSMSWSIDECASFYSNENFTLQWSIIAESLNNAGHEKGAHGYGGIWGGKNASFHHNLIAHHKNRNPRFNGWKRSGLSYTNPLDEERVDFRNNVIYNAGDQTTHGGEAAGKYNIVANYFKFGPATNSGIRFRITNVDIDAGTSITPRWGSYFIRDNFVFGSASVTQDNWTGVSYASGVNQAAARTNIPFETTPVPTHTAEDAFEKVLQFAGASLVRDAVDARIVHETRTGTATFRGSVTNRPGIIDSHNDVGGYPEYHSLPAPPDSNNDGIPDGWLETHFPGRLAHELHSSGYSFVELYINSLVSHISDNLYEKAVFSDLKAEHAPELGIRYYVHVSDKTMHIHSEKNLQRVWLTDVSGRIVMVKDVNDTFTSFSLEGLSPSVYVLTVSYDQSKKKSFKIVW